MSIDKDDIQAILRGRLESYRAQPGLLNEGIVVSVADGVATLTGLPQAQQGELLHIGGEEGCLALVMSLEQDCLSAIILDENENNPKVREGARVRGSGHALRVPVGPALLGRVLNALGEPIDQKGPLSPASWMDIERPAPPVMQRHPVSSPLMTGYKAIDSMVPIGKGQRELIIGDRQTGKTTLALDIILNQSRMGTRCFYIAIGQKASTIVELVERLREGGAMENTTIVVASAAQSAALQYVAPYAGCTMAEYFRDRGEDALIVYDDLSKHAVAYRQISLLLRRPPGREAYPGDIFYLHSRLLERAASVNADYLALHAPSASQVPQRNFGSLSAFPIIETQGGDFSGFVSTNVVSITDGQIFLDGAMFNSGIRPSVNPGLSVSRIGGAAQSPWLRKTAGSLRTSLAQYRELQSFSQFASDLEESSRRKLELGQKLTALLKQRAFSPLSLSEQTVILFSTSHPLFLNLPLSQIEEFEHSLLNFMKLHQAHLMHELEQSGVDELESLSQKVRLALDNFQRAMA